MLTERGLKDLLQIRCELPAELGEDDLTPEGRYVMILIRELLAKYDITNFQVVRVDRD